MSCIQRKKCKLCKLCNKGSDFMSCHRKDSNGTQKRKYQEYFSKISKKGKTDKKHKLKGRD